MNRFWRTLGSLRLTAWLILAVVVLCLAGTIVPQKGLLGKELYLSWKGEQATLVRVLEWLKLTDIYRSPLAYTLWSLFFLNLLAGMTARAGALWRRCALPAPSAIKPGGGQVRDLPQFALPALATRLRGAGYRVQETADALVAVKNRWTPLATLLFHLSFIVLLVGGAATIYTRFRAEADLAVGEPFQGGYTRILKKPLLGTVPAASFTIAEVRPRYHQRSILTDLDVLVDDSRGRHRCGINRPYTLQTLSFVINRIDVAPQLSLLAADGTELDVATVKLKILDGKADSFELQGHAFQAELLSNQGSGQPQTHNMAVAAGADRSLPQPDIVGDKSGGQTIERELVDPALRISLRTGAGELTGTRLLRPGEELPLATGERLRLDGFSYWVHFYVGAEQGLLLVYAAFALMVAALVVRFGLPKREIRAGVSAEGGWLEGRSEYYPTLFQEEIERLTRQHGGATE